MQSNQQLSETHVMGFIIGTELLGSERGNIEALRAMHANGACVSVVVSNRKPKGGDVGKLCRELGFNTLEIPFGSHFSWEWIKHDRGYGWRQLKRVFSNSWLVHKLIRKHKPDLFLVGNTLAYAFIALALTWHREPLIFRVGDKPINNSRFQFFLWKKLAKRSQSIIAISHFIRDHIEKNLPKKSNITVIHNTPPYRPPETDRSKYKTLHQSKRQSQGVFVGNITHQKGVEDLVDALIELNHNDFGCWILGGGEHSAKMEAHLRTKIANSNTRTRIDMLGYTTDPRPFLKAADWHIAPSRENEALGNVVQEAKAMGTPSIVTPVGGLPETVSHQVTGWVLDGVGAEEIKKQLLTMTPQANHLSSDTVTEEFQEKYSLAHFQEKWSAVVHSVHHS